MNKRDSRTPRLSIGISVWSVVNETSLIASVHPVNRQVEIQLEEIVSPPVDKGGPVIYTT
jgi:hypothetical protein